jgi:ATP-dependent protease HslVU (ClpYQ) peptidase subunit
MTTIACDGQSMAADGQSTQNAVAVTKESVKVFRQPDGSIVGMAGHAMYKSAMLKFLASGEKPSVEIGPDDISALVLHLDGAIALYVGAEYQGDVSAPFSIGSGGEIALGAMLAGASPRQAVEIACQRDIYTGGTITEIAL